MTTATPFAASALAGMTSLSKVTFNSAITTLPANLFQGDEKLTDITLPKTITSVVSSTANPTSGNEYSAFYGSSLETIDMSEITSYVVSDTATTTTTVPAYLFAGLTSLKNVVLKTGTTAIGNYAFQGTSGLVCVKEASQTDITSGYTTTGTLTTIDSYAFSGSGLSSFTATALKDTSTSATFSLGTYAFANATRLTSVNLENATNLATIPSFTFLNATGLKTVTLPKPTDSKNLTLGESAFYNVTSLEAIDFSKFTSLTIEVSNFANANSLKTIDLSGLTTPPNFITTATETKVFTGLPDGAVVKLGSAINTISNPAVFTKIKADDTSQYTRVTLQYPNGLTLTASNVIDGVLSDDADILGNVADALDLSSNSTLTSLGIKTLFGNTVITSLTMPATSISQNTNLYTLGNVNAVTPSADDVARETTTSQYTTEYVPLGNNTKLTNINFVKSNSTTVVGPGSLNQDAFYAIAKIMNSYAYYKSSSKTTDTASVNFKKWESTASSWIQNDAVLTYTATADASNSNKGGKVALNGGITAVDKTSSTSTDVTELTLTYGTTAKYELTHNNIKWNLVYDATAQTLTLTTDATTPANIYKGKSANSTKDDLQVYLKTTGTDGTTLDQSGAQVKISFDLNPVSSSN